MGNYRFSISDDIAWKDWRSVKILHFDLETTGFAPCFFEYEDKTPTQDDLTVILSENHLVHTVEFAAMLTQGEEVLERYHILVRPPIPIPAESSEVHGITDEDVKHCPDIANVWKDITQAFKYCDIAAAYNGLDFDYDMIRLEHLRISGELARLKTPIFDPFVFYKTKVQGKKKSASLLNAASAYGCGQAVSVQHKHSAAHRAMNDVDMQRQMVFKMAEKDIQAHCVQELFDDQHKYKTKLDALKSKRNKRK
jgi:DNA polymerase III epsilon subunit-like protein